MSLFQNRSDFGVPDEHDPDIVHLGSHGCAVLFSRYDRGSHTGPSRSRAATKTLIIQGQIVVTQGGNRRRYNAGEWFEIPANSEYSVDFYSDCSLIEFCFDLDTAH